jgi:hypothetical protein
MSANFFLLKSLAKRMVTGQTLSMITSMIVMVSKFALFLGLVWVILKYVPIHTTAFGIGIVAVPLALAAASSVREWRRVV